MQGNKIDIYPEITGIEKAILISFAAYLFNTKVLKLTGSVSAPISFVMYIAMANRFRGQIIQQSVNNTSTDEDKTVDVSKFV